MDWPFSACAPGPLCMPLDCPLISLYTCNGLAHACSGLDGKSGVEGQLGKGGLKEGNTQTIAEKTEKTYTQTKWGQREYLLHLFLQVLDDCCMLSYFCLRKLGVRCS